MNKISKEKIREFKAKAILDKVMQLISQQRVKAMHYPQDADSEFSKIISVGLQNIFKEIGEVVVFWGEYYRPSGMMFILHCHIYGALFLVFSLYHISQLR